MRENLTKSSGNVFVGLGFDPAEAAVLHMRSQLMSDLRRYIAKHKLTQAQAAKRLGIAQSRVSDFVRGKRTERNGSYAHAVSVNHTTNVSLCLLRFWLVSQTKFGVPVHVHLRESVAV